MQGPGRHLLSRRLKTHSGAIREPRGYRAARRRVAILLVATSGRPRLGVDSLAGYVGASSRNALSALRPTRRRWLPLALNVLGWLKYRTRIVAMANLRVQKGIPA